MNISHLAMTGQLPEGFGAVGAFLFALLLLYNILFSSPGPILKPIKADDWDMVDIGVKRTVVEPKVVAQPQKQRQLR